ncbi:FAD synthase [Euryarchaeota archaeon ex4484_162]|nr:FAD synthase [Thermoplasmata archaeon]OYT58393.1 MAG: FAD synthase [Euryarchaeota archaeon ex4484_162]RLF30966.1 MAG: FAD synthase [Thermoplasmata archaeon]RLF62537.1 MAG: FAD synthase [Thermoplasmata archaeon]HDM25045.1 FAD synthase [Thermoplasmatales archaeon]
MVRVMATGTFDLLHIGHLYYLEEAKKLGDELIVVIANDETVRKNKHNPVTPQEMRRKLVEALKPVDKAVIGYKNDFLKIVEEIKPDIIALGYDQKFDENKIKNALKKRGLNIKIIRCSKYSGDDLNGTRKIIRKIADMIDSKKLYKGEK